MVIPWWFGFVVSGLLALLRYRVPAIPARLASAGLGAFLIVAVLGFVTLPPVLSASLIINGALFGVCIDRWFTQRSAPAGSAEFASLTLNFQPPEAPGEVAHKNVFSWYTTSLMLTAQSEDGSKHRHVFNQWVVAIWFQNPVFVYVARVEKLSGEQLTSSIPWQTDRGLLAIIETPSEPTVLKINVQTRQ